MDAIKTITLTDGKVLKIYQDESPQNPRTEFDNITRMICFHNRYALGDNHSYKSGNYDSLDDLREQIMKDHNPVVIKPLWLYDHSGITISTGSFSCPWDSGQVGWVFISREEAIKNWGKVEESELKVLCGKAIDCDVETYDDYLTGNVFGYVLEKPVEKCDKCWCVPEPEEIESCWGFYGSNFKDNGILENLSKEEREEVLAVI